MLEVCIRNSILSCIIGRDASRAFITGEFTEEGLRDDVLDLPLQDLKHIKEWLKMYTEKYEYKGKFTEFGDIKL